MRELRRVVYKMKSRGAERSLGEHRIEVAMVLTVLRVFNEEIFLSHLNRKERDGKKGLNHFRAISSPECQNKMKDS